LSELADINLQFNSQFEPKANTNPAIDIFTKITKPHGFRLMN